MNTSVPLLQVHELKTWFPILRGVISRTVGHVKAVNEVSFSVREREVLGIAGESGSGKTTLGRSILRLVEPTSGAIHFDGIDVRALDKHALRRFRRRAQIVFQDPFGSLNPRMTIEDILVEPLRIQGLLENAAQSRDRAVALLEMVAMSSEFLHRRPGALSGGQRQRIGIARALAVEPQFIVADEPVSALDVSIQAQIINLLKELKDKLGLSMLFISHDLAVMEYISDRIAVVYLGRIMEIGPAASICNRPQHPYTQALLAAVPDPTRQRQRNRIVLKGDVPNAIDLPSGCVFHTRCPRATPQCVEAVPQLRDTSPDHAVACIHAPIKP